MIKNVTHNCFIIFSIFIYDVIYEEIKNKGTIYNEHIITISCLKKEKLKKVQEEINLTKPNYIKYIHFEKNKNELIYLFSTYHGKIYTQHLYNFINFISYSNDCIYKIEEKFECDHNQYIPYLFIIYFVFAIFITTMYKITNIKLQISINKIITSYFISLILLIIFLIIFLKINQSHIKLIQITNLYIDNSNLNIIINFVKKYFTKLSFICFLDVIAIIIIKS